MNASSPKNRKIDEMVLAAKAAREMGETEKSRHLFESVIAVNANHVIALVALARICTDELRLTEAIEYWLAVKRLRPDISETSLRLARLYQRLRLYTDAIGAYQDYQQINPQHKEPAVALRKLRKVLEHVSAETPTNTLQHVAIAGVSFCGSTILASVLGGLPGVENVGETHWLIEKTGESTHREIDFTNDSDEEIFHCFSCGPQCRVFTREFRRELQIDPINWYFTIAQRLNCEILVSADKNHAKLMEKDPMLRFDALVLFKSPLQAWYSNYRKINLVNSGMLPDTDINKYMNKWAAAYQRFMYEFENQGQRIFLCFDAFCEQPIEHLVRLCESLGLTYDASVLSLAASGQHCIGGNYAVNQKMRRTDYQFEIRELPEPRLPAEHIEAINANKTVQKIYQQLLDRYRRDFPFTTA